MRMPIPDDCSRGSFLGDMKEGLAQGRTVELDAGGKQLPVQVRKHMGNTGSGELIVHRGIVTSAMGITVLRRKVLLLDRRV